MPIVVNLDERLANTPVLAQRENKIDAKTYNIWRRARSRWGAPMRLVLPGLKQINLILSDDNWVCVDAVQYDLPVLAWADMESKDRDAIHTPIVCKLNYYHVAASAVHAKSLTLMEEILTERLRN